MKSKLEKLIIVLVFIAAYYGILYHSRLPVFINEFNMLQRNIASDNLDIRDRICLSVVILVTEY